ncbi:MAG: hypothetical protein CMM48_04440 [Rhodospirillaceae bacterium]|nr:hypothetical protein [Rhodospirillaceae bacterium]
MNDFHSVPVNPVADDVTLAPVSGPGAWRGAELTKKPESWTYELSSEQIDELISAVHKVEATAKEIVEVSKADFPLGSWEPLIDRLRQDLYDGRGFALVKGFPVEELTPLQRTLGYFGIGAHFGIAIPQNAKGHLMGHVCDIGVDYASPTGRGYQSNARLPFHTDSADIVGLLCVNNSAEGGESSIVSSVTLYNEMLARRPDLARLLMGPIYRDRQDEIPDGQGPWYVVPVFNPYQGRVFSSYVRSTVRKAARFTDLPPMTPALEEAMDLLDSLAEDPEFHLDMELEAGDIQLLCNHFMLHSRNAFTDPSNTSARRHLLRLHLCSPDGPPLPPVFENLRGYNADKRPQGMVKEGLCYSAPVDPIDGGPGGSAQRMRG